MSFLKGRGDGRAPSSFAVCMGRQNKSDDDGSGEGEAVVRPHLLCYTRASPKPPGVKSVGGVCPHHGRIGALTSAA